MPEPDNESCQTVQDTVLKQMEVFSQNNPEIVEALGLMNLTMADYLQAVEAIRGGQTFSCSSSSRLPFQVS
jgi:hypothetical protein